MSATLSPPRTPARTTAAGAPAPPHLETPIADAAGNVPLRAVLA